MQRCGRETFVSFRHGNVGNEHEQRDGEYVNGEWCSESILLAKDVLGCCWFRYSAGYTRKPVQQASMSAKVRMRFLLPEMS